MTGGKTSPGIGSVFGVALFLMLMGLGLVFVMLFAFAVPALLSGGAGGVFSWRWSPADGSFGILAMVAGSAILSLSAVILSWPLALGFSSLALTLRSGWARHAAEWLIRVMASIPTVVYGFASIFLLVPLVRRLGGGSGFGWLTAAFVLALLIFPTLVVVMQASLRDKMTAVWPCSAGFGLTRMQAMAHLAVPAAGRGLAAAAGLGFARAAGDTMIALMLAGNAPQMPTHLSDGFRTLTAHIALTAANETGGAAYDSLFAAGALVLLLSCGVGVVARRLGNANLPSTFRPERLPLLFRRLPATCLTWLGRLAATIIFLSITGLIGFVALRGWPRVGAARFFGEAPPWEAILGRAPVWNGIWPACAGTLCLIFLSLAFALFPGIGSGVYLAECATAKRRKYLDRAVDMLASIPSIVMGLFGFMLILFLRRTVLPGANTCLLLSAFCLSLLIAPSLIVATREALEAVPDSLRLTAAALGLSPLQRVLHVFLPAAASGILGGVVLALGRAAEDTAVIMLTGAVANAGLPGGLLDKFEALPFFIYYTAAQHMDEAELSRAFGAGLVLLLLSACLFIVMEIMRARLARRWRGTAEATGRRV